MNLIEVLDQMKQLNQEYSVENVYIAKINTFQYSFSMFKKVVPENNFFTKKLHLTNCVVLSGEYKKA